LFTDVVWADLTFDGERRFDINRTVSGNPFARLPDFNVTIKGDLDIKANAQVDYQSTIVQSGAAYEIAKWHQSRVVTAWTFWVVLLEQNSISPREFSATADVQAFSLGRRAAQSRPQRCLRSGDLEWVDPFVGGRIRHQITADKELMLEGDVGGFGAGSDFSWQVVGTYGFDVHCIETPVHIVIGYRALAVDFSENGRFGRNNLDFVEHGPVMGVKFRW
jgi:hypothetical protein